MNRPVDVAALKRAWLAVERGDFSAGAGRVTLGMSFAPNVAVVGVAGQVGASTVALAVAETMPADVLVDGAPVDRSGLAGVCDRELGASATGWVHGRRGPLLVTRIPSAGASPEHDAAGTSAVVDLGDDALPVLEADRWRAAMILDRSVRVVLVSRCTVPMMGRLATVLDRLGRDDVSVAVVGPPRRRWPREVVHSMSAAVARLDEQGQLTTVPLLDALAVRGLGVSPLPAPVRDAVMPLWKGNPS